MVLWERRKVVLDPPANMPKLSQDRGSGWMEIEMGEFFNETGDDGTVVCSVFGFDRSKSGIIIQGIELRPKNDHHWYVMSSDQLQNQILCGRSFCRPIKKRSFSVQSLIHP